MPIRPRTLRNRAPRSKRKTAYSTAFWLARRKVFLARNPQCSAEGCGRPATEVDHVDGNVSNMAHSNLRAYCKSCHSKKTVRYDGGLGR